jgi:lipid A 3-O-deacylase
MKIHLLTLALVLPTLTSSPIHAAGKDIAGGTFGVYMENDLFAGTDRYYTSGIKLSWSSPDLARLEDTPYSSPFLPLFNLLPYIQDDHYQKNLIFALGQNIYTPDNTETASLVENDRPYAGWLYVGLGVVWKTAQVRNSLILNVGVVGPWSYAQETQRLIHDLRNLDHPNGWDNQLDNELGAVLVYDRTWRWPEIKRRSGLNFELLPHYGAALGNVQTYANLGAEMRFGLNLPDDFGTSPIGPAASTSTPVDGAQGADRSRFDLGLHLFARCDGRAVGHNIFLDGNTFASSHSVDRNPFVADLSVGVALNIKNTKLAYAFVYRTKEFSGQENAQIFGTISLNWTF